MLNYLLFLSASVLLKSAWVISQSDDDNMDKTEAMDMLKKYNYMGDGSPDPSMRNDSMYSQALMMFQMVAGLNETGKLDPPTMAMMKAPRCGLADFMSKADMMKRRRRRYVLTNTKWSDGRVSYNYVSFPKKSSISDAIVEGQIDKAFEIWASVANLNFRKSNKKSDIQISFDIGDHGDGYPLDGPGGTLAHAFFPAMTELAGDMHFDDEETWSVNGDPGTDILFVAVHELGHSLGLQHSMKQDAIMYPYYPGYKADFKLNQDDIDGIVAIYGPRGQRTKPPPDPTVKPPVTPPTYPPLCAVGTLDAIGTLDGKLFAFQGSMYVELNNDGVVAGYPRYIRDNWPALEDNVDAALGLEQDKLLLVFKGKKYWRYSLENDRPTLAAGYPRDIKQDFTGDLPDQFDAIFSWSRNGRIYIIDGDRYYRLRGSIKVLSNRVKAKCDRWYYGYPKSFSAEWGVDQPITSALMYHGRTFFFSNNVYLRYNDIKYKPDEGYPIMIAPHWFGCQKSGSLEKPEMEMEMMEDNMQFQEIESINPIDSGSPCSANVVILAVITFLTTMLNALK